MKTTKISPVDQVTELRLNDKIIITVQNKYLFHLQISDVFVEFIELLIGRHTAGGNVVRDCIQSIAQLLVDIHPRLHLLQPLALLLRHHLHTHPQLLLQLDYCQITFWLPYRKHTFAIPNAMISIPYL